MNKSFRNLLIEALAKVFLELRDTNNLYEPEEHERLVLVLKCTEWYEGG